MTDYGTKTWQYSKIEAPETKRFTTTGMYPVLIKDAKFFGPEVEGTYANTIMITVVGIDGDVADAEAQLRYWIKDSKTGLDNRNTLNTLCGLGKALFGPEFGGVPHPDDMIGAVCLAEVIIKPTDDGKAYPRVYHFTDIDDYYEIYSTRPQHFRRRTGATEQ